MFFILIFLIDHKILTVSNGLDGKKCFKKSFASQKIVQKEDSAKKAYSLLNFFMNFIIKKKMSLYVKVLQMVHHPVKRSPLPYIYSCLQLSSVEEIQKTQKSNALPPCWSQNTFHFDVSHLLFDSKNFNEEKLRITLIESRLFMAEEPLGYCEIPIQSLPSNQLIFQWANVTAQRPNLPQLKVLLLLQLTTDENLIAKNLAGLSNDKKDQMVFNAPLLTEDQNLDQTPWDPHPVKSKYYHQHHLQVPNRSSNENCE